LRICMPDIDRTYLVRCTIGKYRRLIHEVGSKPLCNDRTPIVVRSSASGYPVRNRHIGAPAQQRSAQIRIRVGRGGEPWPASFGGFGAAAGRSVSQYRSALPAGVGCVARSILHLATPIARHGTIDSLCDWASEPLRRLVGLRSTN
jgi:hypothetical protein